MFAYKRLDQLFQRLYIEENCSSEKLASEFSVSKRTIRNDIHELNDFLENYGSKVILKRGVGYELLEKEHVQPLYQELSNQSSSAAQQLESSEDRIKQLLLLLLLSEKELSIDELCNKIFVG